MNLNSSIETPLPGLGQAPQACLLDAFCGAPASVVGVAYAALNSGLFHVKQATGGKRRPAGFDDCRV